MLTNLGQLPSVFTTRESQVPSDEYTGESRLPRDEYTRESQLHGCKYTGESITNSNNSANIQKNLISFLGMSNGTRRRCLMEKTSVQKSCDTVALREISGGGGRQPGPSYSTPTTGLRSCLARPGPLLASCGSQGMCFFSLNTA